MDYELQVKKFSDLRTEEKEQLKNMVNPNGIFPRWLKDEKGYSDRYASLAKKEGVIVGWAAVDIENEGIMNGVGAFTKPEYRGEGIATACLEQVLNHAFQLLEGDRMCFLMYDHEFKELFRPAIENSGFSPSSATLIIN